MFCIEMQFATPLMDLTGDESGGVQTVGDTSIGKSSLLAGADSVWGLGMESWHSTRNGLDLLAASRNGMPLLLPPCVRRVVACLGPRNEGARVTRRGSIRTSIQGSHRRTVVAAGECGD